MPASQPREAPPRTVRSGLGARYPGSPELRSGVEGRRFRILDRATLLACLAAAWAGCGGSGVARQLPSALTISDQQRLLEERARQQPGQPDAWRDLGWLSWLREGYSATPRRAFAAALAIDPGEPRALAGLALLAHTQGDYAGARALWLRLVGQAAERAAGDPWAQPLGRLALRQLESLVDEIPGTAAFAEDLRRLRRRLLPPQLASGITQLLARVLHRLGEEAEANQLDVAVGCASDLLVSGPYGHLPRLGLDRLERESDAVPLAPDAPPPRVVASRACQASVDNPAALPGVMMATAFLALPSPRRVRLWAASEGMFRLLVDGRLQLAADDQHRYLPRVRALDIDLPAGVTEIGLRLAVTGRRVRVVLAAEDPEAGLLPDGASFSARRTATGSASPSGSSRGMRLGSTPAGREVPPPELPPRRPGFYTPLVDYLATFDAQTRSDSESAAASIEALLQQAPLFPLAHLRAADLALDDYTRPSNLMRDQARRHLLRSLELDPGALPARLQLAWLHLGDERPQDALTALEGIPQPDPPAPSLPSSRPTQPTSATTPTSPPAAAGFPWRVAFLRYQALRARGWEVEAEGSLDEALAANPEACSALEAKAALLRNRQDLRAQETMLRRLRACDPRSDDLAELLRQRGDLGGAERELDRLLGLEPERESWRTQRAQLRQAGGNPAGAVEDLRFLLGRRPRDAGVRKQLADAELSRGDTAAARATLEQGVATTPESLDLWRALQAIGGKGPFDGYRLDGREVVRRFEGSGRSYPSPAVLVLDRAMTRVFPGGEQLTLTHNIIRVQSKTGLARWGEVKLPEGAEVYTLRTLKADGSTREPEDIAGKDSVTLSGLEVGDYVELEQVEASPRPAAFLSGFLGERFYFGSFDAPLDRSELLLLSPASMKLAFDSRGSAPPPRREARGGQVLTMFAAEKMPQLQSEPESAPYDEAVASVRPSSGVTWEAYRDFLLEATYGTRRQSRDIQARAQALVAGKPTPRDRLAALVEWVEANIQEGGVVAEDAAAILARRKGSRSNLLAALAAAVGLPCELLVARARTASQPPAGAVPDVESYANIVLRFRLGGEVTAQTVDVDPRLRWAPLGYVLPVLQDAPALRVLPGAVSFTQVHGQPQPELRRITARLEVEPASALATIDIDESLFGYAALEWRDALDKVAFERLRSELEQRSLGFFFPGVSLADLRIAEREQLLRPLAVHLRIHAPRLFARRQDGELAMRSVLIPSLLGRRYVGLASRAMTLVVGYVPVMEEGVTLKLPPGSRAELPPDVALATPFGKLERRCRLTAGGGQVRIDSRLEVPMQRVAPADYPAFVRFARAVDEAEAAELRILLATPPPPR